jgi:hypothetical protein
VSEIQTYRSKKDVILPVVIDLDSMHAIKVCMTIPLGATPGFLKEIPLRDSVDIRLQERRPGRELNSERPLRNIGLGSVIPKERTLAHVSVDHLGLVNGMRMKVVMTFVPKGHFNGVQDDVCLSTQAWLNEGFCQEAFNEAKIFINPLPEGGEETVIELRGYAGRRNPGITFGIEK